jgi:hypothetical protein
MFSLAIEANVIAKWLLIILGPLFVLGLIFGIAQYLATTNKLQAAKKALAEGRLREAFENYKAVADARLQLPQELMATSSDMFDKALLGIQEIYRRQGIDYDFAPLQQLRRDLVALGKSWKYTRFGTTFTEEGRLILNKIIEQARKLINELPDALDGAQVT